MDLNSFDNDEDIQDPFAPEELDPSQLHRTDDPEVWGISDVEKGRTPAYPRTIYYAAGDSASGAAGILYPDPWQFVAVEPSHIGRTIRAQDGGADDGQMIPSDRTFTLGPRVNAAAPFEIALETVWDGAMPQEAFEVVNEDGTREVRQEHSKGLLLGSYGIHRENIQRLKGEDKGGGPGTSASRFGRLGYIEPQGRYLDPPLAEAA